MRCPGCGCINTVVKDSRARHNATEVWRRRQCERCRKRWTTRETPADAADRTDEERLQKLERRAERAERRAERMLRLARETIKILEAP